MQSPKLSLPFGKPLSGGQDMGAEPGHGTAGARDERPGAEIKDAQQVYRFKAPAGTALDHRALVENEKGRYESFQEAATPA